MMDIKESQTAPLPSNHPAAPYVPGSPRKLKRSSAKHGLTTLKRAVRDLGGRVIDKRTALGRALAGWRAALVRDLGGIEGLSTQQLALIDLAIRTKLMLDSIDAWLLAQPTLINRRKRSLLPVVRERLQLADALARYLTQLGLDRQVHDWTPSLKSISQRYGNHESTDDPKKGGEPA